MLANEFRKMILAVAEKQLTKEGYELIARSSLPHEISVDEYEMALDHRCAIGVHVSVVSADPLAATLTIRRTKEGDLEFEPIIVRPEKAEERVRAALAVAIAKARKDPRLFLNKMFILTKANRTAGGVAFKMNELKKLIRARGGVVVDYVDQVPEDAEAYLIAEDCYRTHNFLAAMARGIPCVSHKWLVESMQQEKLLPYGKFKLPAGTGLLNGETYPLPDVKGKLLAGLNIMVHSKTDSHLKRGMVGFKQIWSPIVSLLGARVISDASLADWTPVSNAASIPAFDILLTDASCPPELVKKLESVGKAVVSSEWLIQSIIMGSCPDYSAHPRFRYDSGNEPAMKKHDEATEDDGEHDKKK